MTFLATICVLLTAITGTFAAAYPSEHLNLENYCGGTATLPCPNTRGSAGTVRFYHMPPKDCKVKVTTSESCGNSGNTYAIYFNIRKSYMPTTSKMEIYDTSLSRTLKKQWSGGPFAQTQFSNPTSAGQFRSRMTRRPEISVEYTPSISISTPSHEVFFDYVIVEGQWSAYNTYCSALSGYVNDNYICDTTSDRVNCPYSYSDSIISMNPAMDRQYCGLDGGTIAGIVLGSLFFFALVVGIAAAVARNKQRSRVTQAQAVAFTNNSYAAAPAVTITPGAHPSYPTQTCAPYPPSGNGAMYAPPPVSGGTQKQY